MSDFDAVVVGGGHAGIEASLALARMGFSTVLVTQSIDTIGRMSCNPAIGGIAKGNLVREIDALGGQMAKLIDASMIQFRMLNASRGPAVQAPRAQADKALYASLARRVLESQSGLSLFQDTVTDLLLVDDISAGPDAAPPGPSGGVGGAVAGVLTARGNRITSRAVVLTTGTFMDGRLFIGEWSAPGGRLGNRPRKGWARACGAADSPSGRLKTGTAGARTWALPGFRPHGAPAGGPRGASVFLHHRARPSAFRSLLDHLHQRSDPPDHP